MRSWCDYCDNGCDRCQPQEESYEPNPYDYTPIRRLLRVAMEYIEYIETYLPEGVPPVTHTKHGDGIAFAMTAIRREIASLERDEDQLRQAKKNSAQKDLESAQRELTAAQERVRKATEEAGKLN